MKPMEFASFCKHRYRWLIVGLLFLLAAINYLDRQTLSVLVPSLMTTLAMTPREYSYVVSYFLIAYTVSFAASGWLLDRFGARTILPAGVALWSIAAILHGAVAGWVGLALCRILLGLGEGFGPIAGVKVVGEWIPKRQRALAMGIFSNGNIAGAIIAPPLVVFLQLHFGWRAAFVGTGILGAIWILFWRKAYAPPAQSAHVSDLELRLIKADRPTSAGIASTAGLWSLPIVYGVFAARLLTDTVPLFFSFWLPEYLHHNFHAGAALIGTVAWIPYFAAGFGGIFGGALSDLFVRSGLTTRQARMLALFLAACLTPLAAVAIRVQSLPLALACIACVLAAHSLWIVNLFTLITESVPAHLTARVTGISGVGGSLGGIAVNLAAGIIAPRFGYKPVFTTLACMHALSFTVLTFTLNRPHRRLRPSDNAILAPRRNSRDY